MEFFLEINENSCTRDKIGLHFWCQLLVELEFFNDKVEVVEECLFDVFPNIIIQNRLNMQWLI